MTPEMRLKSFGPINLSFRCPTRVSHSKHLSKALEVKVERKQLGQKCEVQKTRLKNSFILATADYLHNFFRDCCTHNLVLYKNNHFILSIQHTFCAFRTYWSHTSNIKYKIVIIIQQVLRIAAHRHERKQTVEICT